MEHDSGLADSDGDGRTNREELGDVGCRWTENNNAHLSAAVGHPGKMMQ